MPRPPVQAQHAYTVVENAGYERETDLRSFPTYGAAQAFLERQYTNDERDVMSETCLHPAIRLDRADGTSSYEL
ncbi:hypothetical protein [Devosia sp. FJ2-5-3]|uniref:hypothetical protein n=1 Tax=Devosia sp. FJ2-5-3 TaxID=2976680 RepID=UPI0023D8070E|nr:hypothetical protein [Devosia sp. FJ2-5-3]WEJ60221.1 hypothetical protein N0P34_09365 [Devosia sp. FJ2-5-3]